MRGLFFAALAIFGLYAISGKAAENILQSALVKIKDLSFQAGASLLDIVQGIQPLILTVEVTNTQQIGATINKFTGVAYMEGQPVAQVNQTFNISLKPGEAVLVDIPILLNSEAVLNAAGIIINDTRALPAINVQGSIIANSFQFPVDETFTF